MSTPVKNGKPKEPIEIKEFITNLINGDVSPTYAIWLGNKLPKYLWGFWGKELKSTGLKWQTFLKCVSKFEKDVIKWVDGELSWEALVDEIMSGCRFHRIEGGSLGLFKWLSRETV